MRCSLLPHYHKGLGRVRKTARGYLSAAAQGPGATAETSPWPYVRLTAYGFSAGVSLPEEAG